MYKFKLLSTGNIHTFKNETDFNNAVSHCRIYSIAIEIL